MNKKIFILLFTCLISGASFAQMRFFEGKWGEALKEAKSENKLLFVDAYAVWCGPCRWMANNVFPDEQVSKYFNENFINYKLDMEKGEGPKIAQNYKVTAYPTLLFIDSEGNVKHRVLGAQSVEDLIGAGKTAVQKSR
ncbi:MAG: thioredoxin family protein [Chitinophagales bacterium]|nr:thioredoxin family protein [Chitinophagales bacterium]